MRNDPVLKLNQKPHTPYGIVSFIIGIIGMILIVITIIMTATTEMLTRNQQLLVGSLEGISVMFSLGGLGVSIIGEGAIEMERIFVHISLLLHVVLLVYHGYIVWFGFIL